jgi:polyisoprenyl-phosphate glycosyltransferase
MSIAPPISIVIPLLNEESNLDRLYQELKEALDPAFGYEILFVDDGSSDNSFNIIKELSLKDPKVSGISFSRNFGHQVALMAGLEHSRGEVVVTMDADLQHPPSLIPKLYELYTQGYDIVNTVRTETEGTGFMKNLTSGLFYKLLNRLSGLGVTPGSADFRLMSRKVVDAFISIPEKDRFTRGLVTWMGFRQQEITYKAQPRFSGSTKYSTMKMMRFALDGITSFSAKPLRIAFFLGLFTFILGLVYAVYAVIMYSKGETIQGWTSLLLVVLFLGGVQLLSLGIIGEYISRIFTEAKSRPLYFIKDKTGKVSDKQA